MRVVSVYNRYLNRGGEDEVFESEAALLRQHGCEVTLVEDQTRKPVGLFETARFARDTIWSRRWHKKFEALLKEKRPDVVHVHNLFPVISPSIYYACRDAGVPVVQSLHNPRLLCPAASLYREGRACEDCAQKIFPWPGIVHGCYQNSRVRTSVVSAMLAVHRGLDTWRNMVDLFIVFTEFYRQKFIQYGLPEHKIVIKPHFVQPDPGRGSSSGEYALFVGRLSPEKGVPALLKAWTSIGKIPLKIRGNGPLLADAQNLAAQSGGSIEVLPSRLLPGEWADLMRKARFLVWPTQGYYETFGLVAIEAFAFSKPVIASGIGAMAEIVSDGHSGLHFIPGDAADLASRVSWAWEHPREMEAMGRNARREYEAKYTAARNSAMLLDIYQRAMRVEVAASCA